MAPISSISVAAHADQKEGMEKDTADKLKDETTTGIPQPIALPTNISRLVKRNKKQTGISPEINRYNL